MIVTLLPPISTLLLHSATNYKLLGVAYYHSNSIPAHKINKFTLENIYMIINGTILLLLSCLNQKMQIQKTII